MTVGTEIENPPRLPKQMKHWFAQIGVYPDRFSRDWRRAGFFYADGRSKRLLKGCLTTRRFFRVLPHLDRMDICDGDMDRWANSMGASISPIPRSKKEFDAAIKELVRKSSKKAAELAAKAVEE